MTGSDLDSEVSLINPSSIAKSVATGGAAQCFLVIQESEETFGDQDRKLSFKSISDFVQESKYGSCVRLMSSVDKETTSQSAMPERIQGRYFAEAHTYALAV